MKRMRYFGTDCDGQDRLKERVIAKESAKSRRW